MSISDSPTDKVSISDGPTESVGMPTESAGTVGTYVSRGNIIATRGSAALATEAESSLTEAVGTVGTYGSREYAKFHPTAVLKSIIPVSSKEKTDGYVGDGRKEGKPREGRRKGVVLEPTVPTETVGYPSEAVGAALRPTVACSTPTEYPAEAVGASVGRFALPTAPVSRPTAPKRAYGFRKRAYGFRRLCLFTPSNWSPANPYSV
jgi:hypothetical protein